MRSYNAIGAMDFEPNDAAKVVGSNQASATRNYSAAISSEHPATSSELTVACRNIVEAPTVGHREERDSVYLPKVPK